MHQYYMLHQFSSGMWYESIRRGYDVQDKARAHFSAHRTEERNAQISTLPHTLIG